MKFPRSRYALFLVTVLVFLALDLGTKSYIFQKLGMPGMLPKYWLIKNVLGFETSLNEGALFGIGQGFSFVFAGFSVVAFIITWLWLFWGKAAKSRLWTFTLGMMNGGVLGNLYDRLGLHGLKWGVIQFVNPETPMHMPGDPVYAVRDWILVMIGKYHWPNFNIADSCLVVGICILMIDMLLRKEKEFK